MGKKKANEKFEPAEVIEAIRKARGVLAAAARALGCDRTTVYNYMSRHEEVRAAYAEANEVNLDLAEGRLMQQVDAGNTKALLFYLRTKGRARGYGDRASDAALNLTPDDLRGMTDAELDELDRALAEGRTPRLR